MPITKQMELSLLHLPKTVRDDLNSYEGMVADRTADGWLVWVPKDVDDHFADYLPDEQAIEDGADPDEFIPEAVVAVLRYAREQGCSHVLIEDELPVTPDLPTF